VDYFLLMLQMSTVNLMSLKAWNNFEYLSLSKAPKHRMRPILQSPVN